MIRWLPILDTFCVPPARWSEIAASVAQAHDLTLADLIGRSRVRKIAHARQHAYAAVRDGTRLSMYQIGQRFGGRSHQSVWHGIHAHEARHKERQAQA